MRYALGALYLAGWLTTTFLLLRSRAFTDPNRRKHRAIAGIVSAAFAFALAAVWPVSGWILPFLRTAMDDDS
ncbi:hypothetical protein [Mycolicibacterium iranicum]|uniref:Uncharacterized protein n=1 Tax=Mycolicibacterium iranicum TaxID=912594 RepID=A0A178LR06_MYCIR|nr:hypothetical protein [Mycolicibacterium iranicum]OAN36172.1 hypothetical protein A4X20_25420 [Mycolicibacterium iranicum]